MTDQPSLLISADYDLSRLSLDDCCDAYHRNPNPNGPYLIRCRRPARYQLVLQAEADDSYTVRRCQSCRNELQAKVKSDATFEILDETTLRPTETMEELNNGKR
ncbi:MAG: hypothetical protein BroJett011_18830 [Chloroflexota bacterium]|nr:MAG: hypothetical protein BroJett011_18830 [Chloroflexota bacterium]